MKKIIALQVFSVFILFISSSVIYAGGHDSLLFDGAGEQIIVEGDDCVVEVMGVVGNARGSRRIFKDMRACGGNILDEVFEKGQVQKGDKLKAGDSISTTQGTVFMKLSDGRVFMLGHNSSMIVGKDYCKGNTIGIEFHYGYGAVEGKGDVNNNMNITTERGRVDITGTQFSIESRGDSDILRVYEGSVNFMKNMQNEKNITKAQDKGDEMKKLSDDFQAGKISIEEFTKKMQELQGKVTETIVPVKVTAGMESRIVGTEIPTDPAPFDASANPWAEDK